MICVMTARVLLKFSDYFSKVMMKENNRDINQKKLTPEGPTNTFRFLVDNDIMKI